MCQHPWGALIQPLHPQLGTGHGTQSHLMSSLPWLPQTIRQLGNDIEKMLMKIHSGEIVTKLYLRLQEVLKKVSSSSLSTCSPSKARGAQGAVSQGHSLLVPSVPCHSMGDPSG